MSLTAQTIFTGHGQGRSPRQWREHVLDGRFSWVEAAGREQVESARAALAALPGQDRSRPDPVYRLVALRKLAGMAPG